MGPHSDKWGYRVGEYRILCDIRYEDLKVLATEIGHRRPVYRRQRSDDAVQRKGALT